ncbi:MAG: hypothetical protein NTV21_10965 [Planctomycetota bacterium]|nr:hypothetical protein [Planctomycetota bacterium]
MSAVRSAPTGISITARLLDERAEILAERDVAVFVGATGLVVPPPAPFSGRLRSDAQGRVQIVAPKSMAGRRLQLVLTLEGDPERRCWTGSVLTNYSATELSIHDVTLRPPVLQPAPPAIRALDDDALEKRLRQSLAKSKEGDIESPLEWEFHEAGLRGGERWLKFLETALEDIRNREGRVGHEMPCDEGAWSSLLPALRLAQGRPLIAKVIVHPEDCDGQPRNVLQRVRYEVMNLDETEWIMPKDDPLSVLFEVTQLDGTPAERRAWPETWWTGSHVSSLNRVAPGTTTRRFPMDEWWEADLSEQYVLTPGDWLVRLRVAADGSIWGGSTLATCLVFDSDPFVVRIHREQ